MDPETKKKLGNLMPRIWHEDLIPRTLIVDECCNNSLVAKLIDDLIQENLISSAFRGWQQAMVTTDGSRYMLSGSLPTLNAERGDKPVKGYTFSDDMVADLVVAHALDRDVIFLSENTRNDLAGVRKLLKERSQQLRNGRKLTAIYKLGKTDYASFCGRTHVLIRGLDKAGSFFEHLI